MKSMDSPPTLSLTQNEGLDGGALSMGLGLPDVSGRMYSCGTLRIIYRYSGKVFKRLSKGLRSMNTPIKERGITDGYILL